MAYYTDEDQQREQIYHRVSKCQAILRLMHIDIVEGLSETKNRNKKRVKKLQKIVAELDMLLKQKKVGLFDNDGKNILDFNS